MITDPEPSREEQAKKFRYNRRYAIVWLVLGAIFLLLGVVGVAFHFNGISQYFDFAIAPLYIGLAWWYWRRSREFA